MNAAWMKQLDDKARQGDGQACLTLYEQFKNESGTQAARDWLDEALDSNSSSAQYAEGVLKLVSGDIDNGIAFLDLSAKNDNVQAMNVLGQLYLGNVNGVEAVTFDLDKGIAYLEQAALRGNVDAQILLGKCYFLGQWVRKNKLISTYYLKQAVEQGSRTAADLLEKVLYVNNGMN